MLELAERLAFDLANPLTRKRELTADLLERVVGIQADTKAHPEDAFLAWRECRQHRVGWQPRLAQRHSEAQDRITFRRQKWYDCCFTRSCGELPDQDSFGSRAGLLSTR